MTLALMFAAFAVLVAIEVPVAFALRLLAAVIRSLSLACLS